MSTEIEWADAVWNPTVGCSKVSEGCRNCYALGFARRLQAQGCNGYADVVRNNNWSGRVNVNETALAKPLKRRKPTRYFVNSMSDLFHPGVPHDVVVEVFKIMARCEHHQFMILTKRPELMRDFFAACYLGRPMPNVVLGISAENQTALDKRAPFLMPFGEAGWHTFLSLEPLLGPVDPTNYLYALDLVIVGGESGPRSRPMHPLWAMSIRDHCLDVGVPFTFKQWGNHAPRNRESYGGRTSYCILPSYQDLLRECARLEPGIIVDLHGRVFRNPADFQHARFPVALVDRMKKADAGRELEGQLHDGEIPFAEPGATATAVIAGMAE